MSMQISAHAGESLDALLWRTTGACAVEATLAANPGLAAIALALPEGTFVTIPDAAASTQPVGIVQLWESN